MDLTPEENKNEQMMAALQAGSTLQAPSHKFNEKYKTKIFCRTLPFIVGGRGVKVQNAKIMQNSLSGAQLQRENDGEETHTTTFSRTGWRAEN